MSTLTAEVVGLYDQPGTADGLLYAPLDQACSFRRTRVYTLTYEGEEADAEALVRRVLVDAFAEDVHFGGAPALAGWQLMLDYKMKPGALDLEREAVLASYRGARTRAVELQALEITQRVYLFGEGELPAARFVRDICNPAIHTWTLTDTDGRNVA